MISVDVCEPLVSGKYLTLHLGGAISVSEYCAKVHSWRHVIHLHNGRVTYDECTCIDDVMKWDLLPDLCAPTPPPPLPPLVPLASMPIAKFRPAQDAAHSCQCQKPLVVEWEDDGTEWRGTVVGFVWYAPEAYTIAIVQCGKNLLEKDLLNLTVVTE